MTEILCIVLSVGTRFLFTRAFRDFDCILPHTEQSGVVVIRSFECRPDIQMEVVVTPKLATTVLATVSVPLHLECYSQTTRFHCVS